MTRTCGDCSLCCNLLGVPELAKPVCKWCKHVKKGIGCGIYEDRPTCCREFSCDWIV